MALRVDVKLPRTPKILQKGEFRALAIRALRVAMGTSLATVSSTMRGISPVVTATLQRSWQTDPPREGAGDLILRGKVTTTSVAALVLDQGAKPHFPPTGPDPGTGADLAPNLATWIRRKPVLFAESDGTPFGPVTGPGSDRVVRRTAYLIGRSFRRARRPRRQIFTRAFNRLRPEIRRRFNRAIAVAAARAT